MRVASPTIQMHQLQGAAVNEQWDNPEPFCCQLQCFGRTVSLPRAAAFLFASVSVGIPVGLSVYLSLTLPALAGGGS